MSSAGAPPGYTLLKCLRQTEQGTVLLAAREQDGLEVVLKSYAVDRQRSGRGLRAQRELEALRAAAGPRVPAVLDLLIHHTPCILVMTRAPGVPLSEWIPDGGARLDEFLSIAVQLSETLTRVHGTRLIHRDVTPDNVVVDPKTLELHLVDFGIAKPIGALARSEGRSVFPESLAGSLAYMPPEQTGRMNRGCDFRSDLYALGATFFHMLTGRLPFESDDALELVHAHIARLPPDPRTLRSDLPQPLAQVILKLLRKDPEERYPSARALHADLAECRAQLARRGEIDPDFAPGSLAPPDRPRFPARLHGRAREVARLHEIHERCLQGKGATLVLRGEAGCGKSTLVNELRPAVAARAGYLAVGRFDPQRARPYSGWVAILEYLAGQVLLEKTERLERWRAELRHGLGGIARALIDLAPDLQFVLGDAPAIPALEPRQSQARLSLALQRFLSSFASVEHPLVLFLDDVQWSDAGSRLLLEELLPSVPPALLLIAAFNTTERAGSGWDGELVERQRRAGAGIEVLDLEPLGGEHVVALLSDTLAQPHERTRSLAELVERKTGNNPMLVRQFVEHIHERGLLRHEAGRWTWDLASIASADIPDGAVALMTAKIQHLNDEPRRAIALASCIGDEFDIELLGELAGSAREGLERGVQALCDLGLVAPCEQGLRFVHSRIRDAAQELLADAEYQSLHCATGRLLLERTTEAVMDQHVFAIADHLNRGIAQLPRELELRVIQLNLRAGKSALSTGAAATARAYLGFGRKLFDAGYWGREPALGVDLQLRSAEAAFQCRDFEAALELLSALESHPLSWLESAQSAALRLRVLALTRNPEESVQGLLRDLRTVGIRWPLRPTRAHASFALRRAGWRLRLRGTRNLLRRQDDSDPDAVGPLLLATLGGPILRHDLHLSALQTSLVLSYYLRFGYRTSSAFFLAGYAAYRYVLLGGARRARAYAELALELNRSIPGSIYSARSEHVVHSLIYPWIVKRREALAPMHRIAEAARELGDPEYAYYARFMQVVYLALAGDAVPQAEQRLRELAESVERSGHAFTEPGRCQRAYKLLLCTDPREIEPGIAELKAPAPAESTLAFPFSSTMRLLVLCVHARHDLADAEIAAAGERVFRVLCGAHLADYVLYRRIAAAALALRASGAERERRRRTLRDSLRRMRRWARDGPDFAHMALLLEAELEALRGGEARARALYEAAATRASQHDFPHHAALAHESRARLLVELRRETEAASALAQAEKLYRHWGAIAKARAVAEARRQLLGS